MRLLLDTHVVLWLLADSARVGETARELILTSQQRFVSAASTWEINIKAAKGRLDIPDDFESGLSALGCLDLAITKEHTFATRSISLPHADPFDALLVAQAHVEHLTLLTADRILLDAVDTAIDARR